jgi:2'-5' RNA ligase
MAERIPGDGFLGSVLPDPAAQDVLRWRQVHPGILPEMAPPHITMAYPPFVREESWPQIRPALAECLGGFEPFEVVLREVGTFPGAPAYLWLKPQDGGALRRIRDVLAERFPLYVPIEEFEGSFVPHVTVSVFDCEQALTQAQQALAAGLKPIHFWVREFTYGAFDEQGGVRYLDRLPLGKLSGGAGRGDEGLRHRK